MIPLGWPQTHTYPKNPQLSSHSFWASLHARRLLPSCDFFYREPCIIMIGPRISLQHLPPTLTTMWKAGGNLLGQGEIRFRCAWINRQVLALIHISRAGKGSGSWQEKAEQTSTILLSLNLNWGVKGRSTQPHMKALCRFRDEAGFPKSVANWSQSVDNLPRPVKKLLSSASKNQLDIYI